MPWRSDPQLFLARMRALKAAMIGWALLAAVAGVLYFLDPTEQGTSSVRSALDGPGSLALLDEAWSVIYAVGGLATAWGLFSEHPAWSRPGLAMLLGALGLNLACVLYIRGPVDGLITSVPFVIAITVFYMMLRVLEMERRTVLAATRLIDLEEKYERRGSGRPDTGDRRRR